MPLESRTFRVFVSSTFGDLQAERNALHGEVFPKLRRLCESHGCQFQAIDLRWGVRDEAALDQKTMEICLREIERCQQTGVKPNFIVLLGDRYGWRPLPSRINADEFEALLSVMPAASHERLLWSDAQRPDSRGWYRRDDNAVPPEYVLLARSVPKPAEDTEEKRRAVREAEAELWAQTERELLGLFGIAIARLGWFNGDPRRMKYEASATHQEILKGFGPNADDAGHVFAFVRTLRADCQGGARLPIRDLPDRAHFEGYVDADPEAARRLGELRAYLGRHLVGDVNLYEYPSDWGADGPSAAHLPRLCGDVERSLAGVIERGIAGFEGRGRLDLEREAHDDFAASRDNVTGRGRELKAIADYLKGSESVPFVLWGPSGSGKSAILARASGLARDTHADALVVRRFIGATPDSSTGVTFLRSLLEELLDVQSETAELPTGYPALAAACRGRLAQGVRERRLLLFVDALDQFAADDPVAAFDWLPREMPSSVRIVVSALVCPAQMRGTPGIEVEPFCDADAGSALNEWLESSGRLLQPHQRALVLEAFGRCRLPLYLRLAFEEARAWRSFDGDDLCQLGEGLPGVIGTLVDRLSNDSNHGTVLVERSLTFLATARYGLADNEILSILSADTDVWDDFEARAHHRLAVRRLPVIVWSRLSLDLEPYLASRRVPGGVVVSFYHRQVAECVATKFLGGDVRQERHAKLADYFAGQATWLDARRSVANGRKASELVYHLVRTGRDEDVDSVATLVADLEWIDMKCRLGLVFDLVNDYDQVLGVLPEYRDELRNSRRRQECLDRWSTDITRYASECSHGRRIASNETRFVEPGHNGSESELGESKTRADCAVDVMRQQPSPRREPVFPDGIPAVGRWTDQRILEEIDRVRGNPSRVDRVRAFGLFVASESHALLRFGGGEGFVLQHAFNFAPGGPVRDAGEHQIPEARVPAILRLWPRGSSQGPVPTPLLECHGHKHFITRVCVSADARLVVSHSRGEERVWDLKTGACLEVIESVKRRANPAEIRGEKVGFRKNVTPDGRFGVFVRDTESGRNARLEVWEIESCECVATQVEHGPFDDISITPDGRQAVTVGSKGIYLWDLEKHVCLAALDAGFTLTCVGLTPDGHTAVAGGFGEIVAWDLIARKCIARLPSPGEVVRSVAMTVDGRYVLSGSQEGSVRMWDLDARSCVVKFLHPCLVYDVAITPDGRIGVSGGWDRTLRVWDLERGIDSPKPHRHAGSIRCMSATADARYAVTGSSDRTVRVWDLQSGDWHATCAAHTSFVDVVAVTPEGRRVVSASADLTLRVWDLASGACLSVLPGHSAPVHQLVVTVDGRYAVSAGAEGLVRVWDLEKGNCVRTLLVSRTNGVQLTPDGNWAVAQDGGVWSIDTGERVAAYPRWSFRWWVSTSEGVFTLDAERDGTLRLRDLCSGADLMATNGGWGSVRSLCVKRDGELVAFFASDLVLRTWNLRSGECVAIRTRGSEGIGDLSIDDDGRYVVSADGDTVSVWDVKGRVDRAVLMAPAPVISAFVRGDRIAVSLADHSIWIGQFSGFTSSIGDVRTPCSRGAEAYEGILQRGLELRLKEKGPDHEESRGHLVALFAQLVSTGDLIRARALARQFNWLGGVVKN